MHGCAVLLVSQDGYRVIEPLLAIIRKAPVIRVFFLEEGIANYDLIRIILAQYEFGSNGGSGAARELTYDSVHDQSRSSLRGTQTSNQAPIEYTYSMKFAICS
jgi:hypothetical protein